MRTGMRLVAAAAAGGLLAGCSVGLDLEPTSAPTSPEVVAPAAEGDAAQDDPQDDPQDAGAEGAADGEDGDAGAEGDAPTDEIAPGTPQQVADVVARIAVRPLPEVAPASGTVVRSGPVAVTVPADHLEAGQFDDVRLFEGPAIRGTRTARAGVQVYPPVTDATWAERLGDPQAEEVAGAVVTLYALEVPGADAAVLEVVTDTAGRSSEDRAGRRIWQAPVTTAQVLVGVGDQVTRIVVQAPPTDEGLETVLSVARTVTATLPG